MNHKIPNKQKRMNMHLLICYSQLMLELLDDLDPTTGKMMSFKVNVTGLLEELNNTISDTQTIQKTTYFNDISNKIDTIVRKNFNPEM